MKCVSLRERRLPKSPSTRTLSDHSFTFGSLLEKDAVLRGKTPGAHYFVARWTDTRRSRDFFFASRAEWRQPLPGG